jgi:hypothetical protein
MSAILTIPRTFGGTIILVTGPSTVATAIIAVGRDGKVSGIGRDGKLTATAQDGKIIGKSI